MAFSVEVCEGYTSQQRDYIIMFQSHPTFTAEMCPFD